MKKLFATIFIFGFLAVGGVALYAFHFVTTPVSDQTGGQNKEIIFEVPPASSFQSVSRRLAEAGLIRNPLAFALYARALGKTTKVHIGEYALRTNMTPKEILTTLGSGKSILHHLTVPEGYNLHEISEALDLMWPGKGEAFLKASRNPELIREVLGENADSLEGYLFPDTYSVTKYMPVETLIRMMVGNFFDVYESIKAKENKLDLPLNELVTLASVIEKETGAAEERPKISSVFHNRLKKGMRLQSDPTIIYGHWVMTGEYLKNIQKKHILEDSRHNTYRIRALPAGPISNPGRESLSAALNPLDTEYLYFVSRNDGTHVFSKDLKGHNSAVKTFQMNSKAREGKSWRDKKAKK